MDEVLSSWYWYCSGPVRVREAAGAAEAAEVAEVAVQGLGFGAEGGAGAIFMVPDPRSISSRRARKCARSARSAHKPPDSSHMYKMD